MITERQLSIRSLDKFLQRCRESQWPAHYILDQLTHFVRGETNLHDYCNVLRDGEATCPVKEKHE